MATRVIEGTKDNYFGDTRLQTVFMGDTEDEIVTLHNVHKTYLLGIEGIPALRGVSIGVKRGEFVVIFGTSGGGKTTMLNIIGTIDKPTKGSVKIADIHVKNSTPEKDLAALRLRKIGFVFQSFNLISSLSAFENVELPMVLAGDLNRAERRTRANQLLENVGMLPRAGHIPAQLSGGEQQRVTIARAIANNPAILLLDEPTGDLDTVNSAIVLNELLKLNTEGGITMIMVTHDVALKNLANRVIWMRDGKVQRVEEVAEARRVEARQAIRDEFASVANGTAGPSGLGSIQDAHTDEAAEGDNAGAFFFRSPKDYRTHPENLAAAAAAAAAPRRDRAARAGGDGDGDGDDDNDEEEVLSARPVKARKHKKKHTKKHAK